ncbi:MAG: phospholipase D-like domain-containing protein [Nanoarchaeota archaeon]
MKITLSILCLFLISCSINANVVKEYNLPTEVYFCPRENCTNVLAQYFRISNKIDCAMYDLNVPELVNILKEKNARMVMDDAGAEFSLKPVIDTKYAQMHNKFCILDNNTVITGSFNPTMGTGVKLNNNNVVIFHSWKIAEAYEQEFDVLYSGIFSKNKERITRNTLFYLNNDAVEVFFCPEDWCANKVLSALDKAKYSINFMIYSFTHDKIGDMLIKKKNQGLFVRGIMEKSQSSQYSEFSKLNSSGIDVKWDTNKGLMHNKVFIIDENTVITGSFNPSLNGDLNNDENLVIIYSPSLAREYLEEFSIISGQKN